MPNISLTAPTDYATETQSIERRRQMAQLLQQQSLQPLETNQTAGGYVVPVSYTQGLAKMLQSYMGARGQNNADAEQKALATRYQKDLADTLTNSQQALTGTPAVPERQPATPNDDNGNANPVVAGSPAVAANPALAASLLMQHPATQGLGIQQIGQDMSRAQTAQRLKDIFALTGGGPAPGASPAPGAAPQAGGLPQAGGVMAGIPPQIVAMMTSGDPELSKLGQTILDASKGIAQRPGAPVVNPFTGAVIAQPTPSVPPGMQLNVGPGGPSASPVPGYASTKEGLNAIPDAGATPVKVPLSGGQEAQLSQPEFIRYQQTGRLPERYGQSNPNQIPSNVQAGRDADRLRILEDELKSNPNDPALISEVNRERAKQGNTGLGTPGLTQPQGDVIRQAREQAGGKSADEAVGKDLAAFFTGGAQDATKQIAQLGDVVKALKAPGSDLTGSVRGMLPDFVRNQTNPQAVAMRERVEEVVQRSLRVILGAQFTEKEGERLISRAYNPQQSPQENAIRVGRLYEQLQQALAAKTDLANYFQKNGTIQGWQGKMPALSDFSPESAVNGNASSSAVDAALKKYGGG